MLTNFSFRKPRKTRRFFSFFFFLQISLRKLGKVCSRVGEEMYRRKDLKRLSPRHSVYHFDRNRRTRTGVRTSSYFYRGLSSRYNDNFRSMD